VKIAFLAAMYGGGTGSPALAALRRKFPAATALLEDAAGQGESGGIVHSVLGRPCPPVRHDWFDEAGEGIERSSERARGRGRFTRNFVIQASAADWANVLVASLRTELNELARNRPGHDRAELVFFQHDEIIVDAEESSVPDVVAALSRAGEAATRLVLGAGAPPIPLEARVVRCYAE
jgi:DNA polymerase-1